MGNSQQPVDHYFPAVLIGTAGHRQGLVYQAIGTMPDSQKPAVLYETEPIGATGWDQVEQLPVFPETAEEMARAEVEDFLDKTMPLWRRPKAGVASALPFQWLNRLDPPDLIRVRFPRVGLEPGQWWGSDGDRVYVVTKNKLTGRVVEAYRPVPQRLAELLGRQDAEIIKLTAGVQKAMWMLGPGFLWTMTIEPTKVPGLPPAAIDCCHNQDQLGKAMEVACWGGPCGREVALDLNSQRQLKRQLRHCEKLPPFLGFPWTRHLEPRPKPRPLD